MRTIFTAATMAVLLGACEGRAEPASPTPFGGTLSSIVYDCADPSACALRCAAEPGGVDAVLDYSEEQGVIKVAISDYRLRPQQAPLRCVQVWFRSGRPALHTHLPDALHCAFGPGFQFSAAADAGAHVSGR